MQTPQSIVTELRELFRDLYARDVADLRQVGTCCEEVGLAGDGYRVDRSVFRSCRLRDENIAQFEQRQRAESAGAGVIATVIEGDEGEILATGETDVPHIGVGDHLPFGQLHQGGVVIAHLLLLPLMTAAPV